MTIQTNNNEKKKKSKNKFILKTILLLINIIILMILFGIFYEYGANPLIIVLILVFAFLTIIGPILKTKRKSYYSNLFPDKVEAKKRQRSQRELLKNKFPSEKTDENRANIINIDLNYKIPRKSLVRKCPKCGMTLGSFVKKCPNCGYTLSI